MLRNIKKLLLYAGFFIWITITLYPFQSGFKKIYPGTVLRISMSSKAFLREIALLEEGLLGKVEVKDDSSFVLKKKLLNFGKLFIEKDMMSENDCREFSQALFEAKHWLLSLKSLDIAQSRREDSIFLLQMVLEKLSKLRLESFKSDLSYVIAIIKKSIADSNKSLDYDDLVRIFVIMHDIMSHFDGVAITEYDFMVLSQVAVTMVLIA